MNESIKTNITVDVTIYSPSFFTVFRYTLASFYVIILLLGVSGNSAVCYIILCKLKRTATTMFLLNLSISDLMMSVFCVPITLISDCLILSWVFGRFLCHLMPLVQGTSVFLSALTHLTISIDRYFVVFYPIRRQGFPIGGAMMIIGVLWIVSISVSIPTVMVTLVINNTNLEYCTEKWPQEEDSITYSIAVMVLQYFLPLVVIIFTYSAISIRIWSHTPPGVSIRSRDEAMLSSKRKMIKMFIVVAVFYTMSQLPRHVMLLISQTDPNFWNEQTVCLHNTTHLLSMSACFYNPILYIWLNTAFRKTFFDVVCCRRYPYIPPSTPDRLVAFPDNNSFKRRIFSVSSNTTPVVIKGEPLLTP